jgi:hypothetical protein
VQDDPLDELLLDAELDELAELAELAALEELAVVEELDDELDEVDAPPQSSA